MTLPEPLLRWTADPVRLEAGGRQPARPTPPSTPSAGGRIRLTAGREGGEAVIRVRDTGIGIAAEHAARSASSCSSRSERSPGPVQGGLGIGLTLVKSLVETARRQVAAARAGPGEGASSPSDCRCAARGEGNGQAEPAAVAAATSRRVLIVDDNPDAGDSLATLLGMTGHRVEVARSGPQGLETR